jgi:hypothetical protein
MASYLRDVKNNTVRGLTVPPQNVTANVNGLPYDFITGDGRCHLLVEVGICNTLTNLAFAVYDSPDNTTYTAISGATITVLNTSSPTNTTHVIGFDRSARYVCTTVTATGSNLNSNCSAVLFEQLKQT